MLLTFAKEQFKNKILAGIKIHSIRVDKHKRWKIGMTIHMWLHSPRNVNKHPFCFCDKHHCLSKQEIWLIPEVKAVFIKRDGEWTIFNDINTMAFNDGFESEKGFWAWFNKEMMGVIIHWTDFQY